MDAALRNRLRADARHLNRVRWAAKLASVRRAGSACTATTAEKLGYVLFSAELGDFSFDIDDRDALAEFLAAALSLPKGDVLGAIEEALHDEQMRVDYHRLGKPSLLPKRMAISGRLLWWVLVRLRRPRLVVETGVWYGLGSAVLLRALELNAKEGDEGELISFDPDTTGGWLVPERLRSRWTWVKATTESALEPALKGRTLDLFIHDSTADYARERTELDVAFHHAAPGAVLISANGDNTPALPELCAACGLPFHRHDFQPRHHIYVPHGIALTVVP